MQKFDIMLSDNGDISIENSDFVFTETDSEMLKQRISITLKMWMEEWFLDTTFGVPYRQKLIRKGVTKEEIDAEFIRIINSFDDVSTITYFKSVVDVSSRFYTMSFYVATDFGIERFSVVMGKRDENFVNTPPSVEPCIYGTMNKDSINSYHKLVNIDLPINIPWI